MSNCVKCESRPVNNGPTHQKLGLCYRCYADKSVRAERQAEMALPPCKPNRIARKQKRQKQVKVFASVDAALADLGAVVVEIDGAAAELASMTGELLERSRLFAHELQTRVTRGRSALQTIESRIRESNAEVRRQAKGLLDVRETVRSTVEAMPAVERVGR